MSQDTWEDVQSEVDDARDTLKGISEDLGSAESCETAKDLDENLMYAIIGARQLLKDLKELRERLPSRQAPRIKDSTKS
jgi:DNA-binding transcriptional regulator YbjK